MNTPSFMQRVVQERGGAIRFLRAEEDGAMCWFYLRLTPEKLAEYERALKTNAMNIRDYGTILESDWGDYPPPEVVQFMRTQHGFETPPVN
jgi:hypothetical protein